MKIFYSWNLKEGFIYCIGLFIFEKLRLDVNIFGGKDIYKIGMKIIFLIEWFFNFFDI